ncbi:MAG: hypothetical protein RLZZ437_1533 [Pseudomonadota bacterium]|jgi:hypothetical protein
MKTLIRALLLIALPLSAMADTVATPEGPIDASGVVLADLIYVNRAVIVFADSPNDPNFIRQMQLLARDPGALAERDALLIVDTNPEARTEVRLKFRPRGFSLVLMEKDGTAAIRKPLPWEMREITNAIDKFPLRRQEVLERNPAGR